EEPFFFHRRTILHVELVAVTMPFEHFVVSIDFFRQRATNDFGRPCAETHAAAFFSDLALLIEQADDWLSRFLIELAAIGSGDAANMSRELNRRHLHPEAKTEIGDVVFARVLGSTDFSLDATFSETPGNQNAGDISELAIDTMLERLGVDQAKIDPAIVARGGGSERFINAFVGVLKVDIFADDR